MQSMSDAGPPSPGGLTILKYPDQRLRQRCAPVTAFDEKLAALARDMLALMHQAEGVGLAAAQVGIPLRIFVMNPGGEAARDYVFVNPELHELSGAREAEEGCLSIPDVRVQVRRALRGRIVACDLSGSPFELEAEEFICRIWQHEIDHLNGTLIVDRMGPGDRIATRRRLRELEAEHRAAAAARRGSGR
jgi:peptide deformylase